MFTKINEKGNLFSNLWDTANVISMNYMFHNAQTLMVIYQNITKNVTDMSYMFEGASSFNPQQNKNINTKGIEDVRFNLEGDFETYFLKIE